MYLARTAALSGLVSLLVVGVSAAAPSSPSQTLIRVCVEVTGSAATLHDLKLHSARGCPRGTRLVTWSFPNEQGPAGPAGSQGPEGRHGAAGLPGSAGPAGASDGALGCRRPFPIVLRVL